MGKTGYKIDPIGVVRSNLTSREDAPRQGYEGAPEAWLELTPMVAEAMEGISTGEEIIVLTWFHLSVRSVLKVHPRGDLNLPLSGVFSTRSPNRPNPIGLHRVKVLEIAGLRIRVAPMEAVDGTPIVDIKPVLGLSNDS